MIRVTLVALERTVYAISLLTVFILMVTGPDRLGIAFTSSSTRSTRPWSLHSRPKGSHRRPRNDAEPRLHRRERKSIVFYLFPLIYFSLSLSLSVSLSVCLSVFPPSFLPFFLPSVLPSFLSFSYFFFGCLSIYLYSPPDFGCNFTCTQTACVNTSTASESGKKALAKQYSWKLQTWTKVEGLSKIENQSNAPDAAFTLNGTVKNYCFIPNNLFAVTS